MVQDLAEALGEVFVLVGLAGHQPVGHAEASHQDGGLWVVEGGDDVGLEGGQRRQGWEALVDVQQHQMGFSFDDRDVVLQQRGK